MGEKGKEEGKKEVSWRAKKEGVWKNTLEVGIKIPAFGICKKAGGMAERYAHSHMNSRAWVGISAQL